MCCIEEKFSSCFCRNKALRCKDVFGQEVGLFDVWIIDSTARLKHRNRDGRFVVYSIHTQTCLQSCLGFFVVYALLYVLCFVVVWLVSCIVSDNRKNRLVASFHSM